MKINTRLLRNWEFFLVVALPLLLLPILFIPDEGLFDGRSSTKFKCAYVVILMAVYWMVEALPLAVTALMPMVLFPLLGVQDTSKVSMNYMKETNMVFVGGLIIALAVEFCNLHRRIALKVMTTVGSSPIRLMFGLMLTTMFLSMWMSNTATSAMVVPIAIAVLDELQAPAESRRRRSSTASRRRNNSVSSTHPEISKQVSRYPMKPLRQDDVEATEGTKFMVFEVQTDDKIDELMKKKNMKKMLLFAVCLSSNIGGTGVITGSASNLVFQEIIKPVNIGQNGKYLDISFATWMAYNVPPMLVNVFITFAYLVVVYYGIPDWVYFWNKEQRKLESEEDKEMEVKVNKMLKDKYEALGRMSFHEKAVFALFILVVCLWLFREPKFMKGWADHVSSADIGDSTAAIFIVLLLFIIPRDISVFFGGNGRRVSKVQPLLDWKYVQSNMPWGVILLMGGGFALSDAAVHSGLSQWLGQHLNAVEHLPKELILILVMILTATITEVASNAACANVVLPILVALSESLNLHPLYLTLPATITCSYAFLLPVATPPNAIVFAAANGDISIAEMAKIGLLPNIVCMLVIFAFHLSYGSLLFNLGDYEYLSSMNITTVL